MAIYAQQLPCLRLSAARRWMVAFVWQRVKAAKLVL